MANIVRVESITQSTDSDWRNVDVTAKDVYTGAYWEFYGEHFRDETVVGSLAVGTLFEIQTKVSRDRLTCDFLRVIEDVSPELQTRADRMEK